MIHRQSYSHPSAVRQSHKRTASETVGAFPLGWYFETELKNRLPLQVTNQRLEVPALEHSAFLYLIGAQPCTRLNAVLNAASDV